MMWSRRPNPEDKLGKSDWFVEAVTDPAGVAAARAMIVEQHYACGVSNAYVFVHGLFHAGDPERLYGVAWWLPPIKNAARSTAMKCGCDPRAVLHLSRLVVDPEVPGNGASYLLGRSIRLIRQDGRWGALLTFADTFRGHSGAIYKATNWIYDGVTRPEPVWVDPRTGCQVSKKQDKRSYRVAEMLERGYIRAADSVKLRFYMCLHQRNPRPRGWDLPSPVEVEIVALAIAEGLTSYGRRWSWRDLVQETIWAFGIGDEPDGVLLVEQVVEEIAER